MGSFRECFEDWGTLLQQRAFDQQILCPKREEFMSKMIQDV